MFERASLAAIASLFALAIPFAPPARAQPAAGTSAPAPGSFLREADHRIVSIVYRLGLAGRALCPEPFPLTGLAFHHLGEYRPQDRPQAIARYGVDKGIGVLTVVEDGPAARSGLAAGDVIVSINGAGFAPPAEIAAVPNENRRRELMSASEELLEEHLRRGPAQLEILRGIERRTLTLNSVPGCPARGRLARSGQDNAFADGRYAIMTTGFLGFFRSDAELAVALAHELAHNILRHPQQLEAQGVPQSGIGRHVGRNARLVRATEEEADRLSVRLLSAAGYDLDAIIPFWRRLYGRTDSIFQVISAHPSLRARERIIGEVLAELRGTPPPVR